MAAYLSAENPRLAPRAMGAHLPMSQSPDRHAEAQIIAAILAGNTHLFHDLIRPYERTVFAMAMAFLRDPEEAEDVVQETFLKALRNLHAFRAEARFSSWLVSIALNEARSSLRRRRDFKSLDDDSDENHQIAPELLRDWREVPSEILERLEVRKLLRDAVTGLPLIYREVFLLREIEELSMSESAQALGISVASVKVRLHRARIMLQKRLAPQLRPLAPKRRRFPW
ncbi:MAG: sigma-70 family RNA polymerase sigma factor [Terracidiphilus sp.]|jgi:RNA polymerase sigma-70 factor (ECF subfamily)